MELLLILVTGAISIVCFTVGAKVGQAASKGERIEVPKPEPMKAIREHQDRKQARAEQDRYETIMHNIDTYDGTEVGQKDVPRG